MKYILQEVLLEENIERIEFEGFSNAKKHSTVVYNSVKLDLTARITVINILSLSSRGS